MIKIKKLSLKKVIIPLVVIVLLAAAGGGYLLLKNRAGSTAAQSGSTTAAKTSAAKRGSLTISASGTGTLKAGQTANLAFTASGTVAGVQVQVGDKVTKGQALASLKDTESLATAVNSAELDLISAKKTLSDYQGSAATNLANAQLAVSTATKAFDEAKAGLIKQGMVRCDQDATDAYYNKYLLAQDNLTKLESQGSGDSYYLSTIVPAKNVVASALATYEYCAGFTDYEITSSQATLSLTEANLKTAKAELDTLTKNAGIDPDTLAEKQNAVDAAQIAYDRAKKTLDGTTLTAPFDGTILSVAGAAGDEVGTATFISLADLDHPVISFAVDETDMDKVAVGESATVVFDALPTLTYTGQVTRVDPSLSSSGNVSALTGLISLDLNSAGQSGKRSLPAGLGAAVEIVGGKAENAVLIPVEALRDLGDGQYGVFVVAADGTMTLKPVTVGLMDATYAEIKDGVRMGELVSTGTTGAN